MDPEGSGQLFSCSWLVTGGFARRHGRGTDYGLFANGHRAVMLARCRALLNVPPAPVEVDGGESDRERRGAKAEVPPCPCCGGPMRTIEHLPGPSSRRIPRWSPMRVMSATILYPGRYRSRRLTVLRATGPRAVRGRQWYSVIGGPGWPARSQDRCGGRRQVADVGRGVRMCVHPADGVLPEDEPGLRWSFHRRSRAWFSANKNSRCLFR